MSVSEAAPPASFQPLSLTPAQPPVFTQTQLILILAITVTAAAGIYLLFR